MKSEKHPHDSHRSMNDHASSEINLDNQSHTDHSATQDDMKPDSDQQDQHDHSTMDHSVHDDHQAHVDHSGHEQMFQQKFWVSLILSIPVIVYSPTIQDWFGFNMPAFTGSDWITPIFSVIVFIYGGLPFLQMASPEIKNRRPGMMTLISLAISVAFVYSLAALFLPESTTFFWELVSLIVVMLLGHWIEMRSVRQASRALDELAKFMPDEAERILADGSLEIVSLNQLKNHDLVLVRPGESVPADGMIEDGSSRLNESMFTGESKPVEKIVGDEVIGGTINGDGSLRVRISATGDETALAGIMRLVEEAQQSKSRTQLLADKAAGWLFYIAIGVAALTAVAWILAVGFEVEVIARVATVLVIACPHALGLAIPLVVAITTSIGARNGVLVRDRLALEEARLLDVVLFDKTGTLTQGVFGVVNQSTAEGIDPDDALALTAAVEGDSEHTIARGLRRSAEDRGLDFPKVRGFEAIKGRGVKALFQGQEVHVGGPRLLEMLSVELPPPLAGFRDQANEKGHTVVYLIQAGQPKAAFELADVIRPESRTAIDRLKQMGVEVSMLTGDSQAVARAVAAELGIQTFFAQVLPENKDQKVKELQSQGKQVAMVGDGVNDAPALARADIGIAIGSGTDVAVESAGIILVQSNPMDIVKIIELSRASHQKMIQNLIWATGYNVVALPLAAGVAAPIGVVLSPAVGALFMSLSTVIVAINAQLLRRKSFAD